MSSIENSEEFKVLVILESTSSLVANVPVFILNFLVISLTIPFNGI